MVAVLLVRESSSGENHRREEVVKGKKRWIETINSRSYAETDVLLVRLHFHFHFQTLTGGDQI